LINRAARITHQNKMAFALIIIGLILVVSTVRNTQDDLVQLVKGDFTGQANFVWWIVVLLIIGAVGYIQKLKPLSDAFLVLLLLVLFLKRGNPGTPSGGFFNQFLTAIKGTGSSSTGSPVTVKVGG
jgi:hypothetical protein